MRDLTDLTAKLANLTNGLRVEGCALSVSPEMSCRLRVMRWTTNMGSVALYGRRSFKRITAVVDKPRHYRFIR
jgi:hypothetical protein